MRPGFFVACGCRATLSCPTVLLLVVVLQRLIDPRLPCSRALARFVRMHEDENQVIDTIYPLLNQPREPQVATSFAHPTAKQIVIVDTALDDYYRLIGPSENGEIRLTTSSSGAGGLRLAPSYPDALWLLGLQLPDMSGFDLLEMLHSLQRKLRVVMVDQQYDRRREQRALELRAVQYVCKPVPLSWLKEWQGSPIVAQESNLLCEQSDKPSYSI